MATVLVTGGNRGIGLELCRQYHARGDDVIAVCRKASDELNAAYITPVFCYYIKQLFTSFAQGENTQQ